MIVSARPLQEDARVDRCPIAARMQCFRRMKAPCRFFPRPLQDRRAGSGANQRVTLISAANAPGCLPSKGYMDISTTITICFPAAQLDDEQARHRSEYRTRQIDLHDREPPPAQSVAANARCGGVRSAAPLSRDSGNGQGNCLGRGGHRATTCGCAGTLRSRLHAPRLHASAIVRCATVGHLVPIANISRREDDGTCSPRQRFHLPRPAVAGEGRQLWKRWCAHPTVSCPHCRRTIMN